MPSWYLEQLLRYKKRINKKYDKEDADYLRLEIMDTVMDAFYRPPYIPKLSIFEVQMGTPDPIYIAEDGKTTIDPFNLKKEQIDN